MACSMLLRFNTLLYLMIVTQIFRNSWLINAIAIDNEVVGVPQIQCTEHGITFSVRTRNVFRGNIYVKGQFGISDCRQQYLGNDYAGATFAVRIGECGMRRIRQLQPHGMNYMLVFVISFHPQFVTKVDRAYNVRCFYAQSDKTVNSEIEVSVLHTESLEQVTMLMPNCEYSVRARSVDGPRVRFSRIGDQLVHRWECNNPNYGMLVKNCFVNDGGGTSVRVLDGRGCPVFSAVIQGPLSYDNSLNLAFVPIWAYKFPDRSQLYFQCQIQVCNKRDNECIGVTPPNCPSVVRPDFIPNSLIDESVDPTQVVGTFTNPQLLQSPPIASRTEQHTVDGLAIDDVRLLPGTAAQSHPFPAHESTAMAYSSAEAFIESGLQPARPYATRRRALHRLHRNETQTQNASDGRNANEKNFDRRLYNASLQKATNEELLKAWAKERLADDVWRGHHRSERTSGMEDETMDVLAQPVYVSDSEPDENGSTRDNQCDETFYAQRICISRSSLSALITTITFISICCLAMLFYIVYGLFTRKKKKIASRQASVTYSTSSPLSSVIGRSSNVGTLVSSGALRQTPKSHLSCPYTLPG